MGRRIRQQRYERQQLDKCAGPAVHQDQRDAVAARCPLMHEVDVDTVKLGAKVMESVQRTLLRSPVERVGPISEQRSQVVQVGALLPPNARNLIGPARLVDACPQIGKYLFLNVDREG